MEIIFLGSVDRGRGFANHSNRPISTVVGPNTLHVQAIIANIKSERQSKSVSLQYNYLGAFLHEHSITIRSPFIPTNVGNMKTMLIVFVMHVFTQKIS